MKTCKRNVKNPVDFYIDLMPRELERGYRILFNGKGKYFRPMGISIVLVLSVAMSLYSGLSIIQSLIIGIIYLLAIIGTPYLIKLLVHGVGSYKMYLTISLVMYMESAVIDFILTLIRHVPMVMVGVMIMLPLTSTTITLLRNPGNNQSIMSYLWDLSKLFAVLLIFQLMAYTFILDRIIVGLRAIGIISIDASMFLLSILIELLVLGRHKSIGTFDYLGMFGTYIYSITVQDGSFFEEALSARSVRTKVKTHIIKLAGYDNAFLVIPYFHGGPIRNVGGGEIIPRIMELGRKANALLIYVHGVGSHELDPVSKSDVDQILRSINDALLHMRDAAIAPVKAIPFTTVIKGDIRASAIPLGEKTMVIVSRINKSTDDIPLRVYEELHRELGSMLDNYMLVDAQNGFGNDNSWSDDDVKDLAEAIKELERTPRVESPLLMGIGHIDSSDISADPAEIGSAGIFIMIIEFAGKRWLLINIDGNNITPRLNEQLISELRNGFDQVIIITTDNHQYTGSFGKLGYKVVGESIDPNELITKIRETIPKINTAMVMPIHTEVETEVKVIGEDGFRGMVEAAARSLKEAPKFVFLYLGLPLILALTLSLLI